MLYEVITENSPNINRLKSKLTLLENRIRDRVQETDSGIMIEDFFKSHNLNEQEQMLFLALLKEEYSTTCARTVTAIPPGYR